MSDCSCVAYHTTRAAEALKTLTRHQFAAVGTHCASCGTGYWSWLNPTEMSTFGDAMAATRTKKCSEAELRSTVDEMVRWAGMTGIQRDRIRTKVSRFSGSKGAGVSKRWWQFWK